MPNKFLFCLLLVAISGLSQAQSKYDSIYIDKSQAIEDLSFLESKIEKNYKPYDLGLVKEAYQNALSDVKKNLPDQISISDFRIRITEVIDELREAHFQVGIKSEKQSKAQREANRLKKRLLPFEISLQDSFLRVHHDLRPDSIRTTKIDSIYAIDDINVRSILDQIEPRRMYDIDDAIAKENFMGKYITYWYRAYIANNQGDSVRVQFIEGGLRKEEAIGYVNKLDRDKPNRYRFIDSISTVIIKIEAIRKKLPYSDSLNLSLYKYATQQLLIDQPENIILDLRGCLGGSMIYTRRWLSLFLDHGSEITRVNKHSGIYIPFLYAAKFKTGNKLRTSRKAKSREDYFHRGNTYVITDESVFSGGVLIAGLLKRYNKALIVGQPTGGKNFGTNAGFYRQKVLPNSNVTVRIPQLYFRIDGKTGNNFVVEGVQPDYPLPYDYDANNTDSYDATIEYIFGLIMKEN